MTPQERKVIELALEALGGMQNAIYNIGGEHVIDLNYAVEKADVAEQTITAIKEALEQPAQEPKCNPHPKAPHGFNRNASHANDRYTCECEGWDAYDAGYQAGVLAGIEASTGQEPEQEPVAVVTGVYGGRFTYAPIKASVILPVGMALYTRPQPRKPLTGEVVVIAAQSCLSPQQYDHFEALLENDQDAHNRLARAIEAAYNIKGEA